MFVIGQKCKRGELLDYVGSKQPESGIIWGSQRPSVVIITSGGRFQGRVGYEDRRYQDGTWKYYGQGTAGDQKDTWFANKLLIDGTRTVLLFTTRETTARERSERGDFTKRYNYEGEFRVGSWDTETPVEGKRAGNKLISFYLMPVVVTGQSQAIEDAEESYSKDDDDIVAMRLALRGITGQPRKGFLSTEEYRRGAEKLRHYALLRASGQCEYCSRPAPFCNRLGDPFLEVHHIERLADDGPDDPRNVAAICPNCHREAHFGQMSDVVREELLVRVLSAEERVEEAIEASGIT